MNDKISINIALLANSSDLESSDAFLPDYSRPGDAGVDLRSTENILIRKGSRALVPCGFSIAIPDGFCGLVIPRSGLAAKSGITVLNSPGLIDSGYRGEIKVVLANLGEADFKIKASDRIAQLVIVKIPKMEFKVVETLDDTDRGSGGFGSTGIK